MKVNWLFSVKKESVHQKTCVYTTQQNEVVERNTKYSWNFQISVFQSKHQKEYWGDCVLYAFHLLNRMSLQVLHNISFYTKLFDFAPDLDHLKVSGCLYFVRAILQTRTKFDERSISHVFIGYPSGIKGYRILDLVTMIIYVNRNVIFSWTTFFISFAQKFHSTCIFLATLYRLHLIFFIMIYQIISHFWFHD